MMARLFFIFAENAEQLEELDLAYHWQPCSENLVAVFLTCVTLHVTPTWSGRSATRDCAASMPKRVVFRFEARDARDIDPIDYH
jgi:hypothetical protein